MREIKFSYIIKHKETGLFQNIVFEYVEIYNGLAKKLFSEGGLYANYMIVAKRQSTGLSDKHGKEVYEGDIVLLPDTESESVDVGIGPSLKVAETQVYCIASVSYKNGGFGFNVSMRSEVWMNGFNPIHSTDWTNRNGDTSDLTKEIEIVGNIYENPELLK